MAKFLFLGLTEDVLQGIDLPLSAPSSFRIEYRNQGKAGQDACKTCT